MVGAAAVLVAVVVLLPCQTQSTQADDELSATAAAASSGTSADIIAALRAENSALRAENLALRRSWAQCRAEDRGVPLAPLRRHLQAATCDLAGVAQAVNRACCPGPCGGHRRAQDDEPCSTVPEVCSADCAAVFMPFFESCHDELAASLSPALTASLDALHTSCQAAFGSGPAAAACGGRLVTTCVGGEEPQESLFPGSQIVPAGSPQEVSVRSWLAPGTAPRGWTSCYSSFSDDASDAATFHAQCDQYAPTLVFSQNSLGYAMGGFAEASWSGSGVWDQASTGNFIFQLSPRPEHYQLDEGFYQYAANDYWPTWGNGVGINDIWLGDGGPPGTHAFCTEGTTAEGKRTNACGEGPWGYTAVEVFRPL